MHYVCDKDYVQFIDTPVNVDRPQVIKVHVYVRTIIIFEFTTECAVVFHRARLECVFAVRGNLGTLITPDTECRT